MTIKNTRSNSLTGSIYRRAVQDAFLKLNPLWMARNPVMFVVEVGSLLTTWIWLLALWQKGGESPAFIGLVALWLWFTVLFANFSEALAEGRGKAQAEALRRTRQLTLAKKLRQPHHEAAYDLVPSTALHKGDAFLVEAGDLIPVDGEVIEGIASVDESAVTGESAPVIRESGGDRSAVTGGTLVLSDWLVVASSAEPGAGRQAPENTQRNCFEHLAGWFHHHFPDCGRHFAALLSVQRRNRRARHAGQRGRAGRATGLPDSYHHWWPAFCDWHRRHGSHDPAQRHRAVRAGGRSCRRRGCAFVG
jgi:hypothetical protein